MHSSLLSLQDPWHKGSQPNHHGKNFFFETSMESIGTGSGKKEEALSAFTTPLPRLAFSTNNR